MHNLITPISIDLFTNEYFWGACLSLTFIIILFMAVGIDLMVLNLKIDRRIKLRNSLRDENDTLTSEVENLRNEEYDLKCKVKTASEMVDRTKDRLRKLQDETAQVKENLDAEKERLYSLEDSVDELLVYVTAAVALKNGEEVALENYPLTEVNNVALPVDSIYIRPLLKEKLNEYNITTLRDLVSKDEDFFTDIEGIGPATVDSLNWALKPYGLHIGMDVIRINDRYFTSNKD